MPPPACAVSYYSRPKLREDYRTWIHPLHAVGKSVSVIIFYVIDAEGARWDVLLWARQCSVGVDVVTSPWRVHDNGVRGDEGPCGDGVNECGGGKHHGKATGETKRMRDEDVTLSATYVPCCPVGCTLRLLAEVGNKQRRGTTSP